jgi:hypothetical protein
MTLTSSSLTDTSSCCRQESRKRKQAHKGAEPPPLVEAELAATELRRWPDYAFLMMADETGE